MDAQLTTSMYEVLCHFLHDPHKRVSARGLARILQLSHVTVSRHCTALCSLGMLHKDETTLYPTYYGAVSSELFQFYQRQHTLWSIMKSGLVQTLQKKVTPTCIVLYGSAVRGVMDVDSDIDIFVQARRISLSLAPYERVLHRHVHLLFESDIRKLSGHLHKNIMNGIVLSGQL